MEILKNTGATKRSSCLGTAQAEQIDDTFGETSLIQRFQCPAGHVLQSKSKSSVDMASAASLLPASLQTSLGSIIQRANQSGAAIRVILLSTTEGVPLGRAYAADDTTPLNEEVLASLESVWAPPSKQFPLLGLDKPRQVTAIYNHGTLVHVYQGPLVVSILCAGDDCNVGAVQSTAIPLLTQVLEPLCATLVESLKPVYE